VDLDCGTCLSIPIPPLFVHQDCRSSIQPMTAINTMSTLTLYCQAMANLRTVLDHLTKLKDEGFGADENKMQSIAEQADALQEILSMAMKAV